MISFGIKEAKRAEEFAKTREQKDTVLAVVRMMNIPITLQKQASKKAKKLEGKIVSGNQKFNSLKNKMTKAMDEVTKKVEEKKAVAEVSVSWAL